MAIEAGTERDTTQALEQVLEEGKASLEEGEVSEKAELEGEKKEEITFTLEQEAEIERRFQSHRDKEFNPYREKREADTALIRSLQSEMKELRSKADTRKLSLLAESVEAGDREEGIEEDKIEVRRKALMEINEKVKEYNENYAVVSEAAFLASELTNGVDKGIADKFNLSDPNPAVRAKGAIQVISDAVYWLSERKAFNKIVEEIPLLQKGSEVRQQIDSFIERYMELSDEKGKDLLIKQLRQEFKVAPRKKPQTPSDVAGGGEKLRGTAALEVGLKEEREKLKI